MICLLTDYKNQYGQDMHRSSIVEGISDPIDAAAYIKRQFEAKGYSVSGIAQVRGEHTLEELDRIAVAPNPSRWIRPLYINPIMLLTSGGK